MNKLIDVLSWQATDPKGVLDRHKFAELILEEIMQELIINGHDDAFIFLNKHFGVEE